MIRIDRFSVPMKRVVTAAIIALALSLPGWVILLFYGKTATLTCTHIEPGQVNCSLQPTWYRLLPLGEPQLVTGIQRAYVDENCDDGECSYRIGLRTARFVVLMNPSTSGWSGGSQLKQETVDRINAFVDSGEGTLIAHDTFDPLETLVVLAISFPWIVLMTGVAIWVSGKSSWR